jgi:dihydrofolate reductase
MDLIVNVTENWGIGKDGKLLVSISADLKRFRLLTTEKTVILGRKTLGTFPGGRPLKNRTNLILSSSASSIAGAEVFPSLSALFARLKDCDLKAVSVIGGASVYRALLPYCDRAYVTKTFLTTEADTFFPNLDTAENWSVAEAEPVLEENGVKFQYVNYINLSPLPLP